MTELYALAAEVGGVVCGTENFSEYHLGYFTLHGDAASDIEPAHGYFKSEVWKMAGHFALPQDIISQIPSAGLWLGQTDEGELGFRYPVADAVIKWFASYNWMDKLGITQDEVGRVVAQIKRTDHKRRAKPTWCYPGRFDFVPA